MMMHTMLQQGVKTTCQSLKRVIPLSVRQYSEKKQIELQSENYVSVIAFNRPEAKNAFGKELIKQLLTTVETVRNDRDTRVLIIRSLVPGVFCAGADLKERAKMRAEDVAPFVAKFRRHISDLSNLPCPVIAAMDGAALGGGLEMALACDMRVASDDAKLGLVETRLAIIPGGGGTQRLARLIGEARAKELVFSSRIFNGKQAEEWGIVNYSVPQNKQGDAAFLKAMELAKEIAANGPLGVRQAKVAISKGLDVDLTTGLALEEACYNQLVPTSDRVEALKAFIEKRPPNFKGE